MGKKIHIFPVNRVEGDLELRIEITDGFISEAWSIGTMYRGIENLLTGRSPMDSLVITPRVCGICSTAHLKAAAKALDMVYNAEIPDKAKKIRNISLGVEMLQNDVRQAVLLFMCDFANPYYKAYSLYDEAVDRYEPLKGISAVCTIANTANIIEITAILGGQWPHSSFMVPGGVVSAPCLSDITQCSDLLNNYRKWYEKQILGCSLERWAEVKKQSDMDRWLDESISHQQSDLGFYIRFAKDAQLDKIGKGYGNFISYGSLDMPENTDAVSLNNQSKFFPAGFFSSNNFYKFNQKKITENSSCSWFREDNKDFHPFEGSTIPYATGGESEKYSWSKAPRYDGLPAETGPLAQMVMSNNSLIIDLLQQNGPSVFLREFARIIRPAILLPVLDIWLKEIVHDKENFFQNYNEVDYGEGFGLIEAPRGALGHWVQIKNQEISKYQIITPSTWNASPRDSKGMRGPWEEALIGVPVKDMDNPVEAGHVIRSFDPCLVCTVHAI